MSFQTTGSLGPADRLRGPFDFSPDGNSDSFLSNKAGPTLEDWTALFPLDDPGSSAGRGGRKRKGTLFENSPDIQVLKPRRDQLPMPFAGALGEGLSVHTHYQPLNSSDNVLAQPLATSSVATAEIDLVARSILGLANTKFRTSLNNKGLTYRDVKAGDLTKTCLKVTNKELLALLETQNPTHDWNDKKVRSLRNQLIAEGTFPSFLKRGASVQQVEIFKQYTRAFRGRFGRLPTPSEHVLLTKKTWGSIKNYKAKAAEENGKTRPSPTIETTQAISDQTVKKVAKAMLGRITTDFANSDYPRVSKLRKKHMRDLLPDPAIIADDLDNGMSKEQVRDCIKLFYQKVSISEEFSSGRGSRSLHREDNNIQFERFIDNFKEFMSRDPKIIETMALTNKSFDTVTRYS